MKIVLLSLPKEFKQFEENIRVTSEEFGRQPPLGLAYVAALMRKQGHQPIIIDANNQKLTREDVLKEIRIIKPDLMAVEIHSIYYIHSWLNWMMYLKKNTSIPILAGGAGFNLYPDEIMSHGVIDYAIAGSVLQSLPQLLNAFENGKSCKRISGLYYKEGNSIHKNRVEKAYDTLDSLPFPARDLLKNEIYWQFITQRKNFTNMLTSTGCSFNCEFCNERGGRFICRRTDRVIEEIEECYYGYGVREIDFFDRTFTINKKRVLELCNSLIKKNLDISWSCRSRVDTIDAGLLGVMKKAGCFAVFYGIESANERILSGIGKGINLNRVREVINTTRKVGIKPLGFFMFGNPGETEESIKKTIDFALSLNLAYATFTKTIAKPKSLYDEMNIRKTGYDYWREYVLGRCKEMPPTRTWTNLDEKMLSDYIRRAFIRFYFRPGYIINTLRDFKSMEEIKRYAISSMKLLFSG